MLNLYKICSLQHRKVNQSVSKSHVREILALATPLILKNACDLGLKWQQFQSERNQVILYPTLSLTLLIIANWSNVFSLALYFLLTIFLFQAVVVVVIHRAITCSISLYEKKLHTASTNAINTFTKACIVIVDV